MPLYSIETHGHLHPFLNYEWLLSNGIGGFHLLVLLDREYPVGEVHDCP